MVNQILTKIREYSISQGNLPACRFLSQQISWAELEERTNWIASILQSNFRIARQTPIVIYNVRGVEFIEYMIAVLKCGCFYIPLENNTPVERVKNIYDDVNAGLILTDQTELFSSDIYPSFSSERWEKTVSDSAKHPCIVDVCDTDLVYCIYTSGTSGKPKGVKIMYRNLINLVESFYDIIYAQFNDVVQVGVLASFSFDSSVKQIYCALFYGHTLCIAEKAAQMFAQKLHDFFARYDVTLCDVTPSHLNLVALQHVKRVAKIPYLLIGGEILHWEQLHAYTRQTSYCPIFINLYGPTECCVDVAYKVISQEELCIHESGIVPIGKGLRNTYFTIQLDDLHTIEEKYTEGELLVSGRQVGAGYVNLTSDAFCKDGSYMTYKTGDIAYYDSNNDIVIIGRNDRQVKIRGNRVELGEILSVVEEFLKCPCVVLCVENEGSNKIAVFISDEQFGEEDKTKLVEHLQCVLPRYMVPHYYIVATTFPLTNNGKIDSKQLQQMFSKDVRNTNE